MLKRDITFEDFDGNKVTETFYFNLSKAELVELEVEHKGGLAQFAKDIIAADDHRTIVHEFKRIVLLAYGVKSEDGRRFIKNDQIREEFAQTNAYSELFMELATNENAAVDFLEGVVPKELAKQVATEKEKLELPQPEPEKAEETSNG